jgi:colanic acid/amylovoran biosynthesis glycosyltransferase
MSEYPAVATVFMLREVRKLRSLNFDISVASINPTGRDPADLALEEQEEAAATFYIKPQGILAALRAHLAVFLWGPIAYLQGLFFALRLGESDIVRVFYSFLYFSEALLLGRWMQARGLKHLHVHFANPAATVGLIASRIFTFGISMTVHGPEEFYDVTGNLLAEKIAGASFICCIGHFTRSQLMKLSNPDQWDKLELVPCGVDTKLFKPRSFRAGPNPFEVLCVGRLAPAKGHHTLLSAMERLVGGGRAVRLRLVGEGPARPSLEREVRKLDLSDHVIFEGAVNQDKIRDLYDRADAFVLPSYAEGVPGVLMEAMAMEIACVATYVGGVPELIRAEVEGILVPASDDRALSEAIERLIDDPDLRRRLGVAGRVRVTRDYDLDRNVARLAQVFDRRLGFGMSLAEPHHSLSAEQEPPQAASSAD